MRSRLWLRGCVVGDVRSAQYVKGVVVLDDDGALAVNSGGAVLPAVWWHGGFAPAVDDAVAALVQGGEAYVLGPVVSAPRPETGTVSGSPSSGLLSVVGSDGVTYSCRYTDTAPSDASEVPLVWIGTTPWVFGTAATYSSSADPDDTEVPTAPPSTESGVLKIVPADAGSRNSGGRNFNDVRQGTYGSYSYTGAYFYGSKPNQLVGATITSARIKLGGRTLRGDYDADLSLNLRRVTNKTKPTGSLTFTGTTDATNVGTAPGTAAWYPLDTTIAQALVDAGGGGIGVSGGSYGGVEGLDQDPYAGTLELTWTR